MAEKLLIVDDDLDTLKLVGLILQRQGFGIVAANGGVQALAKAAAERPDLILLDLMMPDLDGYEVARRLRADPALAHIPIIMFTAKTMLDDKVAGFEAGADDYLTKPTHPTELVAHVKALLARTQGARGTGLPMAQTQAAYTVGLLGSKGGVGVTTVALNFAAVAAQSGQEVIMADLHPGSGALGLMLGLMLPQSLATLVTKPANEINSRAVASQLVSHTCGMRVLAGEAVPSEVGLIGNTAQWDIIVKTMSTMCKVLALDLGTGLTETAKHILPQCSTVVVVTDPTKVALTQTKALLAELSALGLTASRQEIVLVNRVPSSLQVGWQDAEKLLGQKISVVITPAAELAYQASEVGTPLVLLRPDSLTADQMRTLSTRLLQKVRTIA